MRGNKLRRLKRVKVAEVSFVDTPAFSESRALFMKQACTLEGIAFTADSPHDWLALESLTDSNGSSVLATAIVLQAGDPKPDGGTWSEEEVTALFEWWCRHLSTPGRTNGWRLLRNADGSVNVDAEIIAWGTTGDKGKLDLYASGDDALIPPHSWFVQLMIDGPTVRDIIADPKVYNGLTLLDALVLAKAGDDQESLADRDDWGGPADEEEQPDDAPAGPGTVNIDPDPATFDPYELDPTTGLCAGDLPPLSLQRFLIDRPVREANRRKALDDAGGRIGAAVVKRLEEAADTIARDTLVKNLVQATKEFFHISNQPGKDV